jgi:capsular polysaccharide biosynthesis protein
MTYEGYLDWFKEKYAYDGDELAIINERGIEKISDLTFVLGGHNNYYHWILNWVPRIYTLKKFSDQLGVAIDEIKILVASEVPDDMLDILFIEGINKGQIIKAQNKNYHIERALVPNFFDKHCYYHDILNIYRLIPQRIGANPSKLKGLYVDRNDLPVARRKIHNNDEVKHCLKYHDISSVHLSGSIRQQIDLFCRSSIVVGAHGAGLANMVFSPKNTSLVLFEYKDVSEYEELARLLGFSVYKIPTMQLLSSEAAEARLKDFYVDTELLMGLLRAISLKMPALI